MSPVSSYIVIAGASLCAGGFYQAFVGNFPVFGGCIAFAGVMFILFGLAR